MVTTEAFKKLVSTLLRQPIERLTDETPLNTLVAESLILVEMVIELQEEFKIRLNQEQLSHVKTVGDLAKLFVGK